MKTLFKTTIGRRVALMGCVFVLISQACTAAAGNAWDIIENESTSNRDNSEYGALNSNAITLAHTGLLEMNLARLTDKQLNQIRGGIGRFSFGISFTGLFDKLGSLTGQIFSSSDSVSQEVVESTI